VIFVEEYDRPNFQAMINRIWEIKQKCGYISNIYVDAANPEVWERLDGTEWLKSRGRIVGLDKLGNEVEHSFTDPEIYKPQTQYAMRDKDPNDSSKGKERKCIAAGINEASAEYREYTLPFSTKNFEHLFKQRPGQSPATVSLSIFEEGSSEKPRQITDPEKFKSTPFDDLWNEATTIKVKLDRSIKDQLQDRQYG
jgi:hypothetical protein